MNILASALKNLPVISLQTGEAVAWTLSPVLQLATFSAVGFRCQVPGRSQPLLVVIADIRQFAHDCLIIDSEDELVDLADVIRLRPVIEAGYSPLGKPVLTESGHRIGTVENFGLQLETCRIQQLQVQRSLLKAWLGLGLTIDRNQISQVTADRIVVKDTTVPLPSVQTSPVPESQA